MNGIHVLALNSLSALYLIFLVLASLVVIELYSRNNTFIRAAGKVFSSALRRTRITAVTGDAVLRTFATFVFLSSTKNLFAFYAMIRDIDIVVSTDGSIYRHVLFADPTIEFLSLTHLMFMLIPTVQCLFLVFIPSFLLIVYPTRLYKSLSTFMSPRKQLAITSFVESLNSCFKEGLNETRDYRACAGVVMFLLPSFNIGIHLILIHIPFFAGFTYEIRACYLFSLLSLLISYVTPFKSSLANMSVSFCFTVFALSHILVYFWYNLLSVSTPAFEAAFVLIGIAVQTPVTLWAVCNVFSYARKSIFFKS